MDTDLMRALGRLKFRTSYGQNIYYHSKEVAFLAGIMAKEIGANVDIAKRGGLLHDVGKAIDSDNDLTHVELGVEIAKRSNEHPMVINCIAAHHGDVPHSCVESIIVQVADAMSASRPGARRDTLENYIERLGKLEAIATSFDGIESAYAVHAGRELRVIVNNAAMSDAEAQEIARQICLRIEEKFTVSRKDKSYCYSGNSHSRICKIVSKRALVVLCMKNNSSNTSVTNNTTRPLLSLLCSLYPQHTKQELFSYILCGDVRVNDEVVKDHTRVIKKNSIINLTIARVTQQDTTSFVSRGGNKLFPY